MKVENGKKSMKATILWKSALVALALLVFLFPILGEAGPMRKSGPQVATQPLKVTTRPLSDFLSAQGTSRTFFPPVPDYAGWADHNLITFALVDYAGLANHYLNDKLGTRINGTVIQSELSDGSTQIKVVLSTTKALGFAQSVADIADNKGDFLNTLTIFGNKAQDVANGAEAAVGQSNFLITFSISGPGVRLPDLQEVLFNNSPDYMPINFSFTSTTPGKRADGTKAVLQVNQAGSFTDAQTGWVYTAEKVEIVGAPSN